MLPHWLLRLKLIFRLTHDCPDNRGISWQSTVLFADPADRLQRQLASETNESENGQDNATGFQRDTVD